VKLDATYIKRIAHAAVFDAVQPERVIRFAARITQNEK
jgi:hypothetical protein